MNSIESNLILYPPKPFNFIISCKPIKLVEIKRNNAHEENL